MMEGYVSGSVQIWMDPDSEGPNTYGSGCTTLCRKVYLYLVHVNEPVLTFYMWFNGKYSSFTVPACLLNIFAGPGLCYTAYKEAAWQLATRIEVMLRGLEVSQPATVPLSWSMKKMRPTPHNNTLCRAQPILSALSVFPKLNAMQKSGL